MLYAHIIAIRRLPELEIKEIHVPQEQAGTKVLSLRKTFDSVFVYRYHEAERRDK